MLSRLSRRFSFDLNVGWLFSANLVPSSLNLLKFSYSKNGEFFYPTNNKVELCRLDS